MHKRIACLLGSFAIGALALCGCANEMGRTAFTELARADKGWMELSDYQRGKRYLQVHDYGLAIEAFSSDIRRNPNAVNSLNGLAIAYDRIGRTDVAEQYFAQALTLEPASRVTLNNLAYLHMAKGENQIAAELLARAKAEMAREDDTPSDFLTAVLKNNERMLQVLAAVREEGKPAPAPTPIIERTGEREWLFRGAPQLPVTAQALAVAAALQAPAEPAKARKSTPVEIVNASGRSRLARDVGQYLTRHGFAVSRLLNAQSFGRAQSVVFCQHDARQAAETVAASLPVHAVVVQLRTEGQRVQLFAGQDLNGFDAQIAAAGRENTAIR